MWIRIRFISYPDTGTVRCIADLDPGCRGIGLNADPVGQIQGVKNHTHGKTYIFVFLVFSETLKSNNFDKIL